MSINDAFYNMDADTRAAIEDLREDAFEAEWEAFRYAETTAIFCTCCHLPIEDVYERKRIIHWNEELTCQPCRWEQYSKMF